MTTNNLDLIKSLLVACDQSYFMNPTGLKGTELQPLPDRNLSVGEYQNQQIYNDMPAFAWNSGYKITEAIDIPSIGAKALVYFEGQTCGSIAR